VSRISADFRLRRLLAIIPWIAAQDGVEIDEVCRRFDVPRQQLIDDLNTVMYVGIYPFSPAEMIEVSFDDDVVRVDYADWFTRPFRLTPEQALALVAASQSLLAVEGADPDGPLARALDKLASVLGVDPDTDVDVDLGRVDENVVETLRRGLAERRQVRIDYYTFGRDERSERVIEPHRIYSDQGSWYVAAHCHRAEGARVFRVDRVHTAELLDDTFDPPEEPSALGVFSAGPDDPRVVLRLDPTARWVAEQHPYEEATELADGGLSLTLAITAVPWLERLLLRLGPAATVTDAPPELNDVGARAARRVLGRYRS
jgi:proteasome accessory factor C